MWFKSGAQTLGGASRIALLAAIHETGSITSGAKAVGLSYKAAWAAIDTMNSRIRFSMMLTLATCL